LTRAYDHPPAAAANPIGVASGPVNRNLRRATDPLFRCAGMDEG
jgi:hypothetical protein